MPTTRAGHAAGDAPAAFTGMTRTWEARQSPAERCMVQRSAVRWVAGYGSLAGRSVTGRSVVGDHRSPAGSSRPGGSPAHRVTGSRIRGHRQRVTAGRITDPRIAGQQLPVRRITGQRSPAPAITGRASHRPTVTGRAVHRSGSRRPEGHRSGSHPASGSAPTGSAASRLPVERGRGSGGSAATGRHAARVVRGGSAHQLAGDAALRQCRNDTAESESWQLSAQRT